MTTRLFLAASLVLATPLSLTVRMAYAQDAPPTSSAQSAQSPAPGSPPPAGSRGDRPGHPWGPRHDWDRGDHRDGGMDRGREPGRGWARGEGRGEMMLPFGIWWRNPEVATRIGLTAEQQKRIGDLFLQSRVQLIHLHASLQEDQLMLEPLLEATPFDEAKAEAQIDKIADTRAELEKTNAKMLLNIRGVLTADQWTKLRSRGHAMHRPGEWGDRGSPRAN